MRAVPVRGQMLDGATGTGTIIHCDTVDFVCGR